MEDKGYSTVQNPYSTKPLHIFFAILSDVLILSRFFIHLVLEPQVLYLSSSVSICCQWNDWIHCQHQVLHTATAFKHMFKADQLNAK